MTNSYFNDQFLIAMPTLADPNFFHAVTYICEHTAAGAFGLVVNRPLDLTLAEVAAQMTLATPRQDLAITTTYGGGPEDGFIAKISHKPLANAGPDQSKPEGT